MQLLSSLIFLLCTIHANAQQWSQIMDFPAAPRDDGTSFVIGSKAYCGTGRDNGFSLTSDFYAFDFNSSSWTAAAFMPDSARRQYATSVTWNNEGFLFGGIGSQNNYLNDLWRYNSVADVWTFEGIAPFAGRSGAQSFVLGDTLYVLGGRTATSDAVSELWAYDLVSQQWSQRSSLPTDGIWRGFALSFQGKGIAGLGKDSLGNTSGAIFSYDPANDVWTNLPNLQSSGWSYVGAGTIGTRIFLFGGVDALGSYSNAFRYVEMADTTWHDLNAFPADARKGAMTFCSSTDFYVTTGISSTERLNETWRAYHAVALPEMVENVQLAFFSGNQLRGDSKWTDCIAYDGLGRSVELESLGSGTFECPNEMSAGIYSFVFTDGNSVQRQRLFFFNQ